MRRICAFACVMVLFGLLAAPGAVARANDAHVDFTGPSLGLQTGYGLGASDWCFCTPLATALDAAGGSGGVVAGGHAGYGLRLGPLVLEGETRISFADIAFAEICAPVLACKGQAQWLGEADLNAGIVVFGDTLIAATAGYAAGDVRTNTTVLSGVAAGMSRADTAMHDGPVYGARIEQAIGGGWRFGLEYRHYEMSGTNEAAEPLAGASAPVQINWHASVTGLTFTYELGG